MEQLRVKQIPTQLLQHRMMVQVPLETIRHNILNRISFSSILTSSIEKARGSYSPNPSINEQSFELLEVSMLTPRFSTSLFFTDVS